MADAHRKLLLADEPPKRTQYRFPTVDSDVAPGGGIIGASRPAVQSPSSRWSRSNQSYPDTFGRSLSQRTWPANGGRSDRAATRSAG